MLPAVSVKGRVIYDDDCGICRAFRKSAEKNADPANFEFIPRRDADPDDYLPYSQSIGTPDSVIFIDSKGRSYKGAAAIGQILCQIKRPWNILGKAIMIPIVRNIAEYAYKICARQRHRISKAFFTK